MAMKDKINMNLQNLTHILIGIVCIGLLPNAQAVVPAPDGGYPGGNTAEGQSALFNLTSGGFNTAVGLLSLRSLTTGSSNTGVGAGTLLANTADGNTATGVGALFSNSTGPSNTANGAFALFNNTTNGGSTATGYQALVNSTGFGNTANGYQALIDNTTGNGNTALGAGAAYAVTTATNVICIGTNMPGKNINNSCFIGAISGIQTANADAVPVVIDSDGQLGTQISSARYKKEIKAMNSASEAILGLKPVTFQYKSDTKDTPQFGLIAEEVAKVNPDLIVRDKNGEIYTVRYDAVNAMLLNEFLKEHRTVQDLKSAAAKQEAMIARQQKQIGSLTAGLQKVSAQIELSKPTSQTVLNNH
jgi:hypothetical protein